jgi:hypothetical protein
MPTRWQSHHPLVMSIIKGRPQRPDPSAHTDCTVNDRGDIEYRHDAALKKIMALRSGRVIKPKKPLAE